MKTFLYGPGILVRTRRGAFPLDRSLVGRTGLILALNDYRPKRYGVILEGETELREFAEDELEPTLEAKPADQLADAGPGVGPPPSGGSGGQS